MSGISTDSLARNGEIALREAGTRAAQLLERRVAPPPIVEPKIRRDGFSIRRAITIMRQRSKLPLVRSVIDNQTDRARECGVKCLTVPEIQILTPQL